MSKTLYILRGVSGSGKTTLAYTLENSLVDAHSYAADDYFTNEGIYEFEASKLKDAHFWCKTMVEVDMKRDRVNIIVHNTNTSEREIKPYTDLADKFGYKVVSLVVENRHGSRSVHDVPSHVLENQEGRLLQNIKLK